MQSDPFSNTDELLRRVYAYVAYRVRNRSDAEDLTSETFERALRYRQTYDPHKGEPIGWLIGIARRCIYDAAPRANTRAPEAEAPMVGDDPTNAVLSRLELAEALGELSDGERELLALRYGADLSTREIGRLLDMKSTAVDVALSRARSRLKHVLEASQQHQRRPAPNPAPNGL
jgi:RNA polymerase sigma-70 factor (ECF subfamily)